MLRTLQANSKCFQNMKHLGHIADADGILLWFPSQNRTFLVRKPYVFGSETVCFWFGNRTVFGSETVRFWGGERKRETA